MFRLAAMLAFVLVCEPLMGSPITYYPKYGDIVNALRNVQALNGDLVRIHTLGTSTLGQDIVYAKLSLSHQNPDNADKPGVLLDGGHHGDEPPTVLAVLDFLNTLLDSRNATWLRSYLQTTDIYLIPVLNPDGYQFNNRFQAVGYDLNRDYWFPGRDHAAFLTKETQAMAHFLDTHHLRGTLSLHSGMQAVLWPYGFKKGDPQSEVGAKAMMIGKRCAQEMGFTRALAMYDSYPTYGSYTDYAFTKHKTVALTFEISEFHSPPQHMLSGVLSRSTKGIRKFFELVAPAAVLDLVISERAHDKWITPSPISAQFRKLSPYFSH